MRRSDPPQRPAWAAAALLLALGIPEAARADGLHGALGLASAQVLRGVSLSNGSASASLDLNYRFDNGWAAGASLATLGRDAQGDRYLVGLSLARRWQLDADWGAQAGVAHYAYPGGGDRHRSDYDELSASVGWRGLVTASLAVLPNASRRAGGSQRLRGRAYALEVNAHQRLVGSLALDAGLGWMNLNDILGASYPYGSLGLSWGAGPVQVYASRVFSRAGARGLAAPAAGGDRWLGSLLWSF